MKSLPQINNSKPSWPFRFFPLTVWRLLSKKGLADFVFGQAFERDLLTNIVTIRKLCTPGKASLNEECDVTWVRMLVYTKKLICNITNYLLSHVGLGYILNIRNTVIYEHLPSQVGGHFLILSRRFWWILKCIWR